MYRIYTEGNYFFIVDNASNFEYEGLAKDVKVRRLTTTSTEFFFDNVNNWDERKGIEFSDIQDASGSAYSSLSDWIDFYRNNTGKSSPQAGGQIGDNGWVLVTDSQYTQVSPLVMTGGVRTKITNNANTLLNIVGLSNGATIWNNITNKLQPDNSGDTYDVRFQCTANPAINNRNLQLELDIGGTQGVIWDKTLRLARGANVDTRITETMDIFTLDTFIANGGEFYLTCDGDVEIYNISFKIERKFKNPN